jgi:flagellin-like protein
MIIRDDSRAASPVIGVVLVVAITVVVAALVSSGVFQLPLPTEDSAAPSASFSTDYDEDTKHLTVRMESGQAIERSTLTYVSQQKGELDGEIVADFPTEVTATDELVLLVEPDDTVRIVWESPDHRSDSTAVLFRWTAGSQGE